VPNIFREHQTQVPLIADQHAVGEFGSDRTHEPFSETVRPRTTRRNPHHADTHIGQDRIEGCGELTGPISDQDPELGDAIAKIHHQVAGLLGSPSTVRVRGHAQQVHGSAGKLQDEQHVDPLQIAPSKTDAERLLVISPELADVLSAIISRVRGDAGAVPLVVAYDYHERVWNPPMPLLFQRRFGGERRPITGPAIRELITSTLANTGLTDASGQPLRFLPHDFRRILITDAIMHGMPPHIAQLVAGHRDINVTIGYKAVYPEEVINAHRAFIARRRALRPSEEYRTPTGEEWDEFLGHFERRKLSLGTCGRAYGTSCIHEHSCIRCPLLRPDPAQRARLIQIHDNLVDRIAEARQEGWHGEVDGLNVSLTAVRDKLAQLDTLATRRRAVNIGMPATQP
jgi:hypothetical protein